MPTAEPASAPSTSRTSDSRTDRSTLNDNVAHPAQQNDGPNSTTTDNKSSEAKRSYVNAGTFFQSMLGDDDKIELLQDLTGSTPCGVGTISDGQDGVPRPPPSSKRDLRTGLPTSTAAFAFSPPKSSDDEGSHAQASGHGSYTPSKPLRMTDERRGRTRTRE